MSPFQLWRNPWEAIAINYCIANCYAKEAGRTLSSAHDIFSGVDYKQSLILHSMGNYLTSFYLSEVLASGQVIEPVFTVSFIGTASCLSCFTHKHTISHSIRYYFIFTECLHGSS